MELYGNIRRDQDRHGDSTLHTTICGFHSSRIPCCQRAPRVYNVGGKWPKIVLLAKFDLCNYQAFIFVDSQDFVDFCNFCGNSGLKHLAAFIRDIIFEIGMSAWAD